MLDFNYLGDPGKKTFMYFSSEVGKGFIISDDEEVTGVISVKNPSRKKTKKHKSIKDKISESIYETLRRNTKQKRSKTKEIPNFLFVNKPYFSSEESLNSDSTPPSTPQSNQTRRSHSVTGAKNIGKQFRSELMLNIPNRLDKIWSDRI